MDFSYDYYSDFTGLNDPQLEQFMEQFGFAIIGVMMVVALIALAVFLATYILGSIGNYTIAKRRGIRNPWLAWIPLANLWITGCISDQYQYVVKGKTKNRRKLLLILGIANVVVSSVLRDVATGLTYAGGEEAAMAGGALSLITALLSGAISVTMLVFYYMSLYDLYSSCNPSNNVLFLVLSIIFRVTEPFFVFFNRKRDDGMPPIREEPQQYIPQEYTCVEPETRTPQDGPEML